MQNPFEVIEERLSNIESLILSLKDSTPQPSDAPAEELLNVQQAAEFLDLTVPTIYSKVHKCELPVMKRSKRLYFSSIELMEYLKAGRKKTNVEVEAEADDYISNKH